MPDLPKTKKQRGPVSEGETLSFSSRLRKAVGGLSLREFSSRAGISTSGLRQYLEGESEPTRPVLIAVARASGVSVEWLATGEGSMRRKEGVQTPVRPWFIDDKTIDITPVVVGSAEPEREPEGFHVVLSLASSGWVIQELQENPEHMTIRFVRGDSMEPRMRDGDAALVDTSDQTPSVDGIYVLLMKGDQTPMFRRLQRLPGGTIRATCENPAYASFEFSLGGDVTILGRVVWLGHRL